MAIQVLINLTIASLWMFLQDEWSVLSFTGGYFVGLFVVFCMRRFFPTSFYLKKIFSIIKLFLVFLYESIVSSFYVISQVVKPKIDVTPGIFKLDTDLESDLEVTLLALLITLTPGSVVVEVTPDNKVFYVHGLNLPESIDAVLQSKVNFEKAIKEVTR